MHGILDRFETNDKAVILIESINKELVVPIHSLPQGSQKNTWFHIEMKNDTYTVLSIDEEKTKAESEKATDLMSKLRAKKRTSKFKRK